MNAPLALSLRRLDARAPRFAAELDALVAFEAAQDPAVDAAVAAIVDDVRARGDAALLEYTARFDRVHAQSVRELEITRDAMRNAHDALPAAQRKLRASWLGLAPAQQPQSANPTRPHQRISSLGRRSSPGIVSGRSVL